MKAKGIQSFSTVRFLVAVSIVGLAFLYGFISHRNHLPPYGFLTGVYGGIVRYQNSRAEQELGLNLGIWRVYQSRTRIKPGDGQAALAAVPYLQGYTPSKNRVGVILWNRERAFNGWNLYVSGHAPEALLVDMDGTLVHRWSTSVTQAWPDYVPTGNEERASKYWRNVQLLKDGGLIALFDDIGVVRLDRNSNHIWSYRCACHHDFDVSPDGSLYLLARETLQLGKAKMMGDSVIHLSAAGALLETTSLTDALRKSNYAVVVEKGGEAARSQGSIYVLHTNSIRVLTPDNVGDSRAPRILVSFRTPDTVAVIDLATETATWAMSSLWASQHDAQRLTNGHFMVFDNLGASRSNTSRVLEFDPRTLEVTWKFEPNQSDMFFTPVAGTAQRLENGNTILVESTNGRAIEVTQDGDTVWEYVNPNRAGPGDQYIAMLYNLKRYSRSQISPLVVGDGRASPQGRSERR